MPPAALYLLERGLDVVGLDVEVGELVGLVAEGGDVAGDAFGGTGVDHAHGAGVDGPAEDVLVEGAGRFFIFQPISKWTTGWAMEGSFQVVRKGYGQGFGESRKNLGELEKRRREAAVTGCSQPSRYGKQPFAPL